ncbi:helix-turn-helix transcriptional regulator [Mycetocola zhadangensis]|uniref:WYL domain-containing protein n=1 Tax=Mycetocola zhadangensis TaxID=1164595 RepID=A0A3L7J6L7_9MICO|nr:WYL domain-containing protein [Mycetocola zhadangensis]RLQ86246.1 WYL domain-containing protein [Mycetocola zhadangensis]GGE89580.1 WYL domain-containing protein [Mycetocola zhadangensis]
MSEPPAAAPVPVEERLFSLVLALLATEQGLTKSEILSTVQGYRQRYSQFGDNASLDRQFERDKDDIRELGIPLETLDQPGDPGNNQSMRYRIPKGEYDLPSDITFSPTEIALLSLAATVWRQGSLSAESQRAMLKLNSLGIESDDPVIGYAPRVRIRESAFDPLRVALDKHAIVKFPYLKPGEPAGRTRTVAPLALVQHRGRWHLSAHDIDVDDNRTFLLSRIVGPVVSTSKTWVPPELSGHAERSLRELDALWESQVAVIRVEQGTDAATRLSKRAQVGFDSAGADELRLHYTDVDVLADELAGYGPEVLVLTPDRLRSAVLSRHHTTVERHRDTQPIADKGSDRG